MSHEVPNHEREGNRNIALFNVDVMTDDDIVVLYRGISTIADHHPHTTDQFDPTTTGDDMCDRLASEIRALAARDPERVKQLVHRAAFSVDSYDRSLAANSVVGLVQYDWEFTRDVIVHLAVDHDNPRIVGEGLHYESISDAINSLRNEVLDPEQLDDLNARLVFYRAGF